MRTRLLLTAFMLAVPATARAEFSLLCDEKVQLEDILRTDQSRGFGDASLKLRAYTKLLDDRQEGTCAVANPPHPAKVGQVVGHFEAIEFLPGELHDVLIVEVPIGGRLLFGTINRFVAEKKAEAGT